MLNENEFLIQAQEEKSLVKHCLEFVSRLFKCSEAAFETTNGRETMVRSSNIRLQKGKYSWPELSDTSKRHKEIFLTKAPILSDNLKTFAFLHV